MGQIESNYFSRKWFEYLF